MDDVARNRALAHGLARICLGINIAVHGLARLGHIGAFAAGLRAEFGQTILPGPLVELSGYGIVIGEACIGLLILLGLGLRGALVAGMVLMLILQFGTCLRQDWNAAGTQLLYVGLYAVLLATLQCDRYSLDGWRRRGSPDPTVRL